MIQMVVHCIEHVYLWHMLIITTMINDFIEEETFSSFFLDVKFQKLKEQYSEYIGIEE